MSPDPPQPPHHPLERRFTDEATHPGVEPLASYVEYARRVDTCRRNMMKLLDLLGPEWVVAGAGRVEGTGVGALVIGPPGIFLIWPIAGHPEPVLWIRAEECRRHLQNGIGVAWPGTVEIVFYSSHGEGPGEMVRDVYHGDDGESYNVLIANGAFLDRLLMEWEPASGIYIAPEWIINQFAPPATAQRRLWGPDPRANQVPVPPLRRPRPK